MGVAEGEAGKGRMAAREEKADAEAKREHVVRRRGEENVTTR